LKSPVWCNWWRIAQFGLSLLLKYQRGSPSFEWPHRRSPDSGAEYQAVVDLTVTRLDTRVNNPYSMRVSHTCFDTPQTSARPMARVWQMLGQIWFISLHTKNRKLRHSFCLPLQIFDR
jgi:hypothetical protein